MLGLLLGVMIGLCIAPRPAPAAVNTRTKPGVGWISRLAELKLNQDGKVSETTVQYLYGVIDNFIKRFNGYISFGDGVNGSWAGNVDAQYITVVTPSSANTEFEVVHGLDRVPIGYDVLRKDKAADIYDDGGGDWGPDIMFLKCSASSASIKLRIY